MKPILQTEASECGLACLAMMANFHGHCVEMPELRQRFSTSLKGMNLTMLMRFADAMGFAARPVRADLDEVDYLQLPCIIHWNMNHFMILKKIGRKSKNRLTFEVVDPAFGERTMALEEFTRGFTGVALELTPTPQFTTRKAAPAVSLRDLAGNVTGVKVALLQVLILALALEMLSLVAPLFNQFIIDEAIVSGDHELMLVLVLGFGLVLVTRTVIDVARSWFLMRWGVDIGLQWSTRVFSHLTRLPVSYFEKRHLGDIVSKFGSVAAIQSTLTTLFVESALDGLMAILSLGMMLLYSPKLSAIVLICVCLYGCLRAVFYQPLREASRERITLAAKENSNFLETVRAIAPLKLFGRESERRAQWQNLRQDVINRDLKTQKLGIMFRTSSTMVTGVQGMALMYFGALLIMDNALTVGMLMAFLVYAGTFSTRVFQLIDVLVNVKMLSIHTERLADIVLEPAEDDNAQGIDAATLMPSISLRNICFRYGDGEPWIVNDLSLDIVAGQSVALIGPSGCGKTTLCKIIVGLLIPDSGEILIGGTPLNKIGMREFRQILGTVMQNDVLMAGSIMENITFFDQNPDRRMAESVARMAAIHADIMAMPMGFQTLVGDMGSSLSGGQKQRVLLARALYRKPLILALDEATSHLDIENEALISATLRGLKLTKVMVAHRTEAINSADRVIEIRDGKAIERRSDPVVAMAPA